MTEDQILAERARLYARVEEIPVVAESRCLEVVLEGRRWLFPEEEVALLLSDTAICQLPAGVRWCGLPCSGLVQHGMSALPVVCWGRLTGSSELSWQARQDILLLRSAPLAVRVPGPVAMAHVMLAEAKPGELPWCRGELADGTAIADLSRLAGGAS